MNRNELYRALPNMDDLLEDERIVSVCVDYGRTPVIATMRAKLDEIRSAITLETLKVVPQADSIIDSVVASLALSEIPSLRRVVNATGIVIHTNLGRSILADDALDAVVEVATGYSTLEYDVDEGARGSRHDHIEELLCELTGAKGALAVNNNAAAVMLVLSCFAKGKEAVISRGELVEIGGSFRIPEIMAQSNVRMVEVGTTNKTRIEDYGNAMTSMTGLFLKVHTSNYEVIGFTEAPTLYELAQLGAQYDIPVVEDQGSGVLIDLRPFGLPYEPMVPESLYAGASVVTFSGDKLLGGPQAGIIVGQKWAIDELKAHPMVRALRLDKMTLAALEATLKIYRDQDLALLKIPTLRMLTMSLDQSNEQAETLLAALQPLLRKGDKADIVEDVAYAGGGSLPMADIPTMVLRLKLRGFSAGDIEHALRLHSDPPIIARIKDDHLILDPRTFVRDDQEVVIAALADLLSA
ncbi:MAG: L-seryl-tRNA(Sec) selenium transferase [Actinomycetia bacterium]|nr:L-seryl-tRNA(Sec) selenium transferase [Actinomycetes bacterium]